MTGPDDPKVPDENILAAGRALEVVGLILEDPQLRGAFHDAPEDTFNRARGGSAEPSVRSVGYDAVPPETKAVLEAMGPEQLELLGQFGAALIKDGMYFDVPGVGKCYIK
jgi:hypothetical protein